MKTNQKSEEIWIIQRCINAYKNEWEDWPGYCENPMTEDEMLKSLKECDDKWGANDYEFRGHNIKMFK